MTDQDRLALADRLTAYAHDLYSAAEAGLILEAAKALRSLAPSGGEPVAYVPVHPRNGPLWSDTLPAKSELHRSNSYERMPLYATPIAGEPGAMREALEAIRRDAQNKSDFWSQQAEKNEARADHYTVIANQFGHLASSLAALASAPQPAAGNNG